MMVAVARVVLVIPAARSLKDKRSAIRPILARVQREFGLSAAEIEAQGEWTTAVLGLAYVSNDAAHSDEVIARAVRFIDGLQSEALLHDYQTEIGYLL